MLLITGGDLFIQFLTNFLMVIFTFGFAIPWVVCRSISFYVDNLSIIGELSEEGMESASQGFNDAIGDSILDLSGNISI